MTVEHIPVDEVKGEDRAPEDDDNEDQLTPDHREIPRRVQATVVGIMDVGDRSDAGACPAMHGKRPEHSVVCVRRAIQIRKVTPVSAETRRGPQGWIRFGMWGLTWVRPSANVSVVIGDVQWCVLLQVRHDRPDDTAGHEADCVDSCGFGCVRVGKPSG